MFNVGASLQIQPQSWHTPWASQQLLWWLGLHTSMLRGHCARLSSKHSSRMPILHNPSCKTPLAMQDQRPQLMKQHWMHWTRMKQGSQCCCSSSTEVMLTKMLSTLPHLMVTALHSTDCCTQVMKWLQRLSLRLSKQGYWLWFVHVNHWLFWSWGDCLYQEWFRSWCRCWAAWKCSVLCKLVYTDTDSVINKWLDSMPICPLP